jgi:hypothetical protein
VITDPLTTATLPSGVCFSPANAGSAIHAKFMAITSARNKHPCCIFIQISPFQNKKDAPLRDFGLILNAVIPLEPTPLLALKANTRNWSSE